MAVADATWVFGVQHQVNLWQACARAGLIFFYGLVMLRLSGRRTFARMSALDLIVPIIAGSVLGQALTGNAPMVPALAGVGVLIFLHWGIAHIVARSEWLAHAIEGGPILLVRDGFLNEQARRACKIAKSDLAEALREKGLDGLDGLETIHKAVLEPSGKISVIQRETVKTGRTSQ
jgi:uncharacterized membrane protein YcaP (DUF421 family)